MHQTYRSASMQCVTAVRKNNQNLDNVKPSLYKGEQREASLWRGVEEQWKAIAPGAIHVFQRKASPRGNKEEEEANTGILMSSGNDWLFQEFWDTESPFASCVLLSRLNLGLCQL